LTSAARVQGLAQLNGLVPLAEHSGLHDRRATGTNHGLFGYWHSNVWAFTMSDHQPANVTRWQRVHAEWHASPRDALPLAFTHLKQILSAEEYDRMAQEYRHGRRDVRVENGFIVTCFTPNRDQDTPSKKKLRKS
jgi:hypothetical protein